MDKILYLSTVFCSFLPLIAIFTLTPYISRKGTCFGVMLMEDAQKSLRIKKLKGIIRWRLAWQEPYLHG